MSSFTLIVELVKELNEFCVGEVDCVDDSCGISQCSSDIHDAVHRVNGDT